MDKLIIEGGVPLHGEVVVSGAKNAAYLAAQILSLQDPALAAKMKQEREQNASRVMEQDKEIQSLL